MILECLDNPKYPQYIKFVASQQKTKILDSFEKGDGIKIDFFINGNEWTNPEGKVVYFNTLELFKIEKVEQETKETKINETKPETIKPKAETTETEKPDSINDTEDDLPF